MTVYTSNSPLITLSGAVVSLFCSSLRLHLAPMHLVSYFSATDSTRITETLYLYRSSLSRVAGLVVARLGQPFVQGFVRWLCLVNFQVVVIILALGNVIIRIDLAADFLHIRESLVSPCPCMVPRMVSKVASGARALR